MDKRYTRYIENLRRVRALVRPETHAGMKAADLLEEIKQNAAESYTLMQQSNAILDEVIFSRRAENLTEEEAAGLSEFVGSVYFGWDILSWKKRMAARSVFTVLADLPLSCRYST